MTRLLTVGHGTASAGELGARLRAGGVATLVDVRTAPGSRRNPHLGRDALAGWLPAYGVGYRWEPRLGGFRRLPAGSPDTAWRNTSFRAYAAHTRTPEFAAALAEVLAEAALRVVAVMCSETVWWRCHRRLVADVAVLVHGVEVAHLMPGGRSAPHRVSEGARLAGEGLVVYDDTG